MSPALRTPRLCPSAVSVRRPASGAAVSGCTGAAEVRRAPGSRRLRAQSRGRAWRAPRGKRPSRRSGSGFRVLSSRRKCLQLRVAVGAALLPGSPRPWGRRLPTPLSARARRELASRCRGNGHAHPGLRSPWLSPVHKLILPKEFTSRWKETSDLGAWAAHGRHVATAGACSVFFRGARDACERGFSVCTFGFYRLDP